MIFDSDLLVAVIVIIVGMGFFTSSMVEHTNNYADAVKTNILYDKVVYQLKSLISDGTLETAVLLLNNNNSSIAENVLKNRINLKNYELKIGNYTLISHGNLNNTKTIMVSTTILMNRTEGWYGIYGNDSELHITNEHFISESEAYNYLNKYDNTTYPYKKAIYYFNSSNPINITLICGG